MNFYEQRKIIIELRENEAESLSDIVVRLCSYEVSLRDLSALKQQFFDDFQHGLYSIIEDKKKAR